MSIFTEQETGIRLPRPSSGLTFRLSKDAHKIERELLRGIPISTSVASEAPMDVVTQYQGFLNKFTKFLKAVGELNARWADERLFPDLREVKGFAIDTALVDSGGKVVEDPWSSFKEYAEGKPPLTPPELLQKIFARGELLFPLSPRQRTTLYWLHRGTGRLSDGAHDQIEAALLRMLGDNLTTEGYPVDARVAAQSEMKGAMKMTRVRSDQFDPSGLESTDLLTGDVKFWRPVDLRSPKNVVLAHFPRNPSLSNSVVVCSMRKGQIRIEGGLPLDEVRRGVRTIYPDPKLANMDFIAATLNLVAEEFPNHATILRYVTPRTWLGESATLFDR